MAATNPPFLPTVADVERIAAIQEPVLRNLLITQCYCEISTAFAKRTGSGANWCTFATWASKQAGQTIRKEDMKRTLEAMLLQEPEVQQALSLLDPLVEKAGIKASLEQIRQTAIGMLVAQSVEQASAAVSRGNKKVFEEIAREFARFMATCLADEMYNQGHIDAYCQPLRKGPPPEGQDYLCKAFTRYYQSFFATDTQQKTEQQLLANLEIGFHEQTRLQPEIAASLNAVQIDAQVIERRLQAILFPQATSANWFQSLFQKLFQQTRLLDKAVELFVQRAQHHLRRLLTAQMMTLTIPPDVRLRLGQDLKANFPINLKELQSTDLLALLTTIDPTPNSLQQTGAVDWADLKERLHFIADLFRCYHLSDSLLSDAFTATQVAVLKQNKVPPG